MTKTQKVILSLHIANTLIQRGFEVIEVKPSTRVRGRAAFVFKLTPEFSEELRKLSEEKGIHL